MTQFVVVVVVLASVVFVVVVAVTVVAVAVDKYTAGQFECCVVIPVKLSSKA